MKKNLLLIVMAFLFGSLAASAYSVRIEVDNVDNVNIVTNAGNGEKLTLDPYGTTVQIEDSQNPLLIEPANGAEITSVEVNGSATYPSGDGKYRIGITGGTRIVITTSGGGAQNYDVMYFNMGAPGSATVTYGDGTELSSGMTATVPAGTEFTVTPASAFVITSVETYNTGTATENADGSWTCVPSATMSYIYVSTEASATGVQFSINVDFADNIEVFAGTDEGTKLTLYTGKNEINLPEDKQPLLFRATDGAEILQVMRNGEEVYGSPYSGIRSQYADGDSFTVTTRGKATTVTFKAPEGQAALENYTFTAGGTTIAGLSGNEATATLNLGEIVTVTPVGATTLSYLIGGQTVNAEAPSQAVRIAEENCVVSVYGKTATGVSINVDDAARIVLKQANGYGDVLTLQSGLNTFEMAEIMNSLQITAAPGCQILSVTLDGTALTPQNTGAYLVKATEGCYIDITSREIPSEIPMTFAVVPEELAANLNVTIGGNDVELTSGSQTIQVEFGSTVTVSAKTGYKLTALTAGNNVVEQVAANSFKFVALEAATVSIAIEKIQAGEGRALVTVSADNQSVNFYEYAGEELIQTLSTETTNEVTIGNALQVRVFSTGLYLKEVKVNGEPIALGTDARKVEFLIEKDCDVVVTTFRKVDIALYDYSDPVNHDIIGQLFIKDGDNLVKNYHATEGETVTFVSQVADGYILDYIKRVYPESDVEYQLTYTITAEDIEAESIMFQGVYSLDDTRKSYVVRCRDTYINMMEEPELVGYVRISYDGQELTERRFFEGDTAKLLAYSRDDYQCESIVLWADNSVILNPDYVVNGEDADADGVINVQGLFKSKEGGVAGVTGDATLSYDKALRELTSADSISVYDTAGNCVLRGDAGTHSVANLASGLYIAVSGKSVLKFVK